MSRRTEGDLDEVVELAGQIPARLRTRALGLLWASGSLLAFVWLALTRPAEGGGMVAAMASLALAWGVVMAAGAFDRLGTWYLHAAIALVQVVITVAYAALPDTTNDIRLFYVWATPYAALFFRRRSAVLHGLWVAALLATALSLRHVSFRLELSVFLTTIGLVIAAGTLVGWAAALDARSRQRLRHLAEHDPLTGLPNRRLFSRRLRDCLLDERGSTAVLLLDLDSFKVVNDSHGHELGDRLLIAMAPRLAARLGPGDVLARLGGDEFAVLHEAPAERAHASAMALAAALRTAWDEPFEQVAGLYATGCIGVAVSPRSDRSTDATSAETLLREADTALYRAKDNGRASICLFDADLQRRAQRQLTVESQLRGAASRGELSCVYQPIVALDSGLPVGLEALCRWHSPELGDVPPDEFVAAAEECGLIQEVGDFVLREVIGQVARWRSLGMMPAGFAVAVNLSPRQLRAGMAHRVGIALEAAGVPPAQLAMELTEGVLIDSSHELAAELSQLRAGGHTLLLDDFGTGYSSLSYLATLPVDIVKIDRSFVAAMFDDSRSEGVLVAVLRLAQALGMVTVAEGVETAAQADRLHELGCDRAQGWFFGRPAPAAQTEMILRMAASPV